MWDWETTPRLRQHRWEIECDFGTSASRRKRRWRKFWSAIDATGDCWLWNGSRTPNGYGKFGKDYAHRLIWEILVGPIPDGLIVCHHCDVKNCVNPDHLFVGTYADNTADMVQKGRQRWDVNKAGERNGRATFTREQVERIRAEADQGTSQKELIQRYAAPQSTINHIVRRYTWK
jgi:hypothetical protein